MVHYLEYLIFVLMLLFSALIGIYFGFCGTKQNTTDEYLLGGRTMRPLPVALSFISSHMSGLSFLAVPADAYKYGPNYWWICVALIIVCTIHSYVYLPIFFKLQKTSVFEYLHLRFDKRIRTLVSFIYVLSMVMYNAVVIYCPAIFFAQVTGINVHLISSIVSLICIFYTTIGGLKAVVWTDAFQFIGMLASVLLVFFLGASSAGGFGVVWEKAVKGQRLSLSFAVDPTTRDGFWHSIIGGTTSWLISSCLAQGPYQKLLAVPTIGQARLVLVIFVLGTSAMMTLLIFTGSILYAKYSGCDPLLSKQVARNDQIVPHFVMELAENAPGLLGIFIAGIFSASLSTLSAVLNTLSATIYEDFVRPFLPNCTRQKRISKILKLIVVVTGVVSTVLVFVVERAEGVLSFTMAVYGITAGPTLGLFTLGALFPNANSKGAMYGGVGGLVFVAWIMLGNQWYASQGLLDDYAKPVSTENCTHLNFTSTSNSSPSTKYQPFILYRISFWYSTFIGCVAVVVIGLVVSWFTRKNNRSISPDLISPVVHFWLPKRDASVDLPPVSEYLSVDKALQQVVNNLDA